MYKERIKVAITDDHPIVIKGFETMVGNDLDIEVSDNYGDGGSLLAGLEINCPDVLVLDIKLPDMDGEVVAGILQERYPSLKIVVLTYLDSIYYAKQMMRNGVKGYVLKSSPAEVLIKAIKAVSRGEQFIEERIKAKIVQQAILNKREVAHIETLTKREKEILQLLASSYNSQQIAEKLFISKRTVENHRANMLVKLNVKNSASLIKKAIELDLLD